MRLFCLVAWVWPSLLFGSIAFDELINRTHKVGWYMFEVNATNAKRTYLINNRDSSEKNGIRVWNMTAQRSWRPIHNAKSFGGFSAARKNFDRITMSTDGKKITFGKKLNTRDLGLRNFLNDLQQKTHDIKWYYFQTQSGYPFLAFNRDKVSGLSVSEHILNGKWKPLHNAVAFDGYPTAPSIFTKAEVSKDGREITIEYKSFNIPTIPNILPREGAIEDFKVVSDDVDANHRITAFAKNPHVDWMNAPAGTKSLALEIINLNDSKAIWRAVNIPNSESNASFIPKSSPINYNKMTTLPNDYTGQRLFHPTPPAGHDYLLTVYALSTTTNATMKQAKRSVIQYANLYIRR